MTRPWENIIFMLKLMLTTQWMLVVFFAPRRDLPWLALAAVTCLASALLASAVSRILAPGAKISSGTSSALAPLRPGLEASLAEAA